MQHNLILHHSFMAGACQLEFVTFAVMHVKHLGQTYTTNINSQEWTVMTHVQVALSYSSVFLCLMFALAFFLKPNPVKEAFASSEDASVDETGMVFS